MRIDQIIQQTERPVFSFEFFPPKTEEGEQSLLAALHELSELSPDFVSVTWGAGGSTREKTIDIVSRLRTDFELEAMAHFTCVGANISELRSTLDHLAAIGVDNVLALRGDPPVGEQQFVRTQGGLGYANELVELIAEHYSFCVAGACYPEVHLEAKDLETDLAHLKTKVDAGAQVLITQLLFDNDLYFTFVRRAREIGIDVPIIPGVMPILSLPQIERMTALCGATIPPALLTALQQRGDRPDAVREFGVAYATMQCADLLARGAPGIHFYTINRSAATRAILSALKLYRPWESQDKIHKGA